MSIITSSTARTNIFLGEARDEFSTKKLYAIPREQSEIKQQSTVYIVDSLFSLDYDTNTWGRLHNRRITMNELLSSLNEDTKITGVSTIKSTDALFESLRQRTVKLHIDKVSSIKLQPQDRLILVEGDWESDNSDFDLVNPESLIFECLLRCDWIDRITGEVLARDSTFRELIMIHPEVNVSDIAIPRRLGG